MLNLSAQLLESTALRRLSHTNRVVWILLGHSLPQFHIEVELVCQPPVLHSPFLPSRIRKR